MKTSCVRNLFVLLAMAGGVSRLEAQTNLAVYTDSFVNGWENWSWASTSNSTRFVHGGANALAVTADAWEGAYFNHSALEASLFTNLVLWIHGGSAGGQLLLVSGLRNGAVQASTNLPPLATNVWQQFSLPLAALGLSGATDFDGFWIQDRTGTTQPTFYLDDLTLLGGTPPPVTNLAVTVTVDAARDRHPINPLIYGVAFASSNQLRALNCPLNRSGGNSESRYNWQLNAYNHGADWYFQSLPESPATAGAAADAFVADSRAGGAEAMLTVPMVGWAPKLGPNRGRLASYSIAKYGAQTGADSQWFPDAGNGIRASDERAITWNDPTDANLPVDVSFQQAWLQHLTNRWGAAANGGVRWYFLDNEPSLWHSTHRDVHPTGITMRELRDKSLAYASMVKTVDPDAVVAGPEEWGWSGYFYSGFDQQTGATNGWSRFPDRITNGGWDYLPWFLDQARQQAATSGRRLLDYFTVHYYPQSGEFTGGTSDSLQRLRNRSTRSLWDTNYVDESWIDDRVMLIPRLKAWVKAHYPGTPIGLTEYNWGAENHINGATAQADLFGLFGREGLDLATRWTTPATGSPVFNAMKLYRNYDGTNSGFGDVSLHAAGADPDDLATFAAERTDDGALTVMLIHKRSGAGASATVTLTNYVASMTAQVWQLTSANVITREADATVEGGRCVLSLPAQSITLLVVPKSMAPRLRAGRPHPGDPIGFWLEGEVGGRYRIERTFDLNVWQPVQTNLLNNPVQPLWLPATNAPQAFFRAVAVL